MIVNGDMSAEGDRIRHEDVTSEFAVVGHVGIGHKIIFVSDNCSPVFFGRGPVHGGAFPDNVVVADDQVGLFAPVPDILGRRTDT